MARPVDWFQRLPQILARLTQSDQPAIFNRQAIQGLFGVERRNAQYLLIRFGATRLGNALIIERQQLISALQEFSGQEDFERQVRRHQQVREALVERRAALQLARITLPDPVSNRLGELPESIRLAPGQLQIKFTGAIDLLSQLVELSRAIGEDFDRFEALLNQDPLPE